MLTTILDEGLPSLAWICSVNIETLSVTVFHGEDVEQKNNFIVEGVWNEEFTLGNFHISEHFFGSGIRVDKNAVWLVPSATLVDRLLLCRLDSYYVISNSLICLLAYLDAELDPEHNYKKQADTILKGIYDYEPDFPILHCQASTLKQLFYTPFKITKNGIERESRPIKTHINSYESYYSALRNSLIEIRENSKSPERKKPFLAYSTISRGYDSAAVTALTKDLDLHKTFTSKRSSSGLPAWLSSKAAIDDGTEIANKLGIDVSYLERKPKHIAEDELLFSCPTPAEPETFFYNAYREIGDNDNPSLVFTGYHGDKLWDKNVHPKYLTKNIIRGDISGLNLGEARLKAGFINVAIPFMYSTQISTLNEISNSSELAPWSIGGDYDRPIPRRILEEFGIERELFGTRKKAVITFHNFPFNQKLSQDFKHFLKQELGISNAHCLAASFFDSSSFYVKKILDLILNRLNISINRTLTSSSLNLPYKLHIWALQKKIAEQKDLLTHRWETSRHERN